jgi:NAD(P)-dependent dehydrogenase (short-subunit alcohol dehydrogenase family)
MIDAAALKRLATPEDIGRAIAGLATAAGDWITGVKAGRKVGQRIEASGGVRL